MRKHLILFGICFSTLLMGLIARADDDVITANRNADGTWTFVKPSGMDLKLEVVYFTKEELDSIASQRVNLNSESTLFVDNDADDEGVDQKAGKIQKKTVKRKRSRSVRSRHRSRRR